jgi:hypothetical protein
MVHGGLHLGKCEVVGGNFEFNDAILTCDRTAVNSNELTTRQLVEDLVDNAIIAFKNTNEIETLIDNKIAVIPTVIHPEEDDCDDLIELDVSNNMVSVGKIDDTTDIVNINANEMLLDNLTIGIKSQGNSSNIIYSNEAYVNIEGYWSSHSNCIFSTGRAFGWASHPRVQIIKHNNCLIGSNICSRGDGGVYYSNCTRMGVEITGFQGSNLVCVGTEIKSNSYNNTNHCVFVGRNIQIGGNLLTNTIVFGQDINPTLDNVVYIGNDTQNTYVNKIYQNKEDGSGFEKLITESEIDTKIADKLLELSDSILASFFTGDNSTEPTDNSTEPTDNSTAPQIIELEDGNHWELENVIINTHANSNTRRIDFQYSDDFSTIISSHTNGEFPNGIFIWKLTGSIYILVNPTNIDAMNITGYANPEGYSISLGNFWFGAASTFGDDSRSFDMNNTGDYVLTTSVSEGKSSVFKYDDLSNKYELLAEVNISSPYAKYGTISDDGQTVCLREINYVNNIYAYYYKIFRLNINSQTYEPIFTLPDSLWTYGSIGIFCKNDSRFVIPLKQTQDGLPTLNIYDCDDSGTVWSLTKKLEQMPYGYNSVFDITKDGNFIAFSINNESGSWDTGMRVLKEDVSGNWIQHGGDMMLLDNVLGTNSVCKKIDINADAGHDNIRIIIIRTGRKTAMDMYKYNNDLGYYEIYTDYAYPILTNHQTYIAPDTGFSNGLHNKFLATYSNAELNHLTTTDLTERMALYNTDTVVIYKKYLKEVIV